MREGMREGTRKGEYERGMKDVDGKKSRRRREKR